MTLTVSVLATGRCRYRCWKFRHRPEPERERRVNCAVGVGGGAELGSRPMSATGTTALWHATLLSAACRWECGDPTASGEFGRRALAVNLKSFAKT